MRTLVCALGALAALASVACSSGDGADAPNGNGATGSGGKAAASGSGPSTANASGAGGARGTASSTDSSSSSAAGGGLTFACAGGDTTAVAPSSQWVNATANLANMPSECGNLGLASANPCSDLVFVGVAQKGLWGTEDGGKTWHALGTGAGSAAITNRISSVVYDPDHPGTFWESGIYNAGGVYKTTDNGQTFVQLGTVTHTDSLSIDLTDPARQTMIAGAHEAVQKLYKSIDGGDTWNDIGLSFPSGTGYCTSTLVLDANTFLVGCSTGSGGIYRSNDGGSSWTLANAASVLGQPLRTSRGSIYWPGSNGGVYVSADRGMTFQQSADSNTAVGVIPPTALVELPDGRIVALGKDHLVATKDGATWTPIGDPLPFMSGGYGGASGLTYSARTKTFFIWHWDCGDVVPADAIASAGFDYTTN